MGGAGLRCLGGRKTIILPLGGFLGSPGKLRTSYRVMINSCAL